MSIYLKQSTASQEIPLGPFVDDTDGKTAETALTISNTDIKIWKTGATTLADKNSGGATHISSGIYYAVLDATDTDTLGPLVVFVSESGALPVRVECVVLAANIYDALIGATDKLQVDAVEWLGGTIATPTATGVPEVDITHIGGAALSTTTAQLGVNVVQVSGDSVAADNLEAAADGTGFNLGGGSIVAASVTGAVGSVTGAVGSVTGNVGGNVTGSVGSVAAGGITAASIATGAIDADALAADAVAEIADGVWDEDATGHQTQGTFGQAIGDPAADADSIWALVNTNLNATVSSRASQTSVDTIDGIVDSILDDTGTAGVVVASIAANAVSASALATDAVTEITDAVWAKTLTELSAVPGVTGTTLAALNWLFTLARNKIEQTASTSTLRKDDGTTALATSSVSDDATTFTRGEWA